MISVLTEFTNLHLEGLQWQIKPALHLTHIVLEGLNLNIAVNTGECLTSKLRDLIFSQSC